MKKGAQQRTPGSRRNLSPPRILSPASTLSSPGTRSPSPASISRMPEEGKNPGIRYITETLIKKISKQENLPLILSLNLSLSKDGDKKFKFIENLEKCERLQFLNLGNNVIEKIEKLDKLTKLRDLNLSFNKISKIEGLEHLIHLQTLNLAGNEIQHIPVWVGKKLKALRTLVLRHNSISSLQDVVKLKPLKDMTSLILADNPVANLPHYRLFVIFHLRSLESLDEEIITNEERQDAHDRFNLEEIERLEREVEEKMKEIVDLKEKQMMTLEELEQQDEMNKSLKQEAHQHIKSYKKLERDLETKNELLKQKTAELTRACQKEYALEQELAFYKIDAKFEPLAYYPTQGIEENDVPEESPYIGKSLYKRNSYIKEGYIADPVQPLKVGKLEISEDGKAQNEETRAKLYQALDEELDDKEKKVQQAQQRLTQVQEEIGKAEQQVLRATAELKQLEDAVSQHRISEAEKEHLRQQLSRKILLLNQLRHEAQELERQIDWQVAEISKKQKETEELQRILDSTDPKDPRYAQVKAQRASKEQQLSMMNKHYKELESRLDEMLSRIAKETEDIKDLEQQLTEGQIAMNEALKRDLEGIINGLQEYLGSVKNQAKQAREECNELHREKEDMLHRLAELEEERNQLEIVALETENLRKELLHLEQSFQEQCEQNESLKQAQGDLSAYEAELEAQLQARDTEANTLKEELQRLRKLSQMEHAALQAELEKERQALENAVAKAQLAAEKEEKNKDLLKQLKDLQASNNLLKEQLKDYQAQMEHSMEHMIRPEELVARIGELKRKLETGVGEIRPYNQSDILGKNLAELQRQINEILSHSVHEKEDARRRQQKLEQEMSSMREKMRKAQEDYRAACDRAAEARIESEKRQSEAQARQLEEDIMLLQDKLRDMKEFQTQMDQQLQEADEEREKLLAELEDVENKNKLDDARTQIQLSGLDKELSELRRAMATADKMAAKQLSSTKDQLKSLHSTVQKINQDRAEELEEAQKSQKQAVQAARELSKAEAEIDMLQNLLKERERHMQHELDRAEIGTSASNAQQMEIDRLRHELRRQRSETERLRDMLSQVRQDNASEMEQLLDQIAALRNALFHQNDYITSMADPFRRRGYWYYMPSPPEAPSIGSQSTRDSGVGSQNRTPHSPSKGKPRQRKKKEPLLATERGCWIYSPFRRKKCGSHTHRGKESGEDSGEDNGSSDISEENFVPPAGSVIYTVLPNGAPAPQGTVIYGPPPLASPGTVAPGTIIYGPPPPGSQVVYGPPPSSFSVPFIPAGVLHCNVPEHHDLENELFRLEDIVTHLKSQRRENKRIRIPSRKLEERQRLHKDIRDLLVERCDLEEKVEVLQRALQKCNKHKEFLESDMDTLLDELQLEKSLKHHDDIVDEVECIEKTLQKRRAELREADRLLTDAETELQNTQAKTKDIIQRYSNAKNHLADTEKDAEELERRAQETAVKLVKADQQFRLLQADIKDLEKHKEEKENILKEINTVVSAKDTEFQSLTQKVDSMNVSLEKLEIDIHLSETLQDQLLQTLKETENIIQDKRQELEKVDSEVVLQQEKLTELDRELGKKKEELCLLTDNIDQKNSCFKEVLRGGEAEVFDKRRQIKELKSQFEDVKAKKGELDAQNNEKRAQLSLLKQEVTQEEENLQNVLGQINKHKAELKHVLEMLQLESIELEGIKQQHHQKVNELEKIQVVMLEEKVELEKVQLSIQRQRGEAERQKQVIEKNQQEMEQLSSQSQSFQNSIESQNRRKSQLENSCFNLEAKLAQTKRDLTTTEDDISAANSALQKLESVINKLKEESSQLNSQKQTLSREIVSSQSQLEDKNKQLERTKDDLEDTRDQLRLLEEDMKATAKRQDELLNEKSSLKEEISQSRIKYQNCLDKENRKEQELQQLEKLIEEKKQELADEEKLLQHIKKDVENEEERLVLCAAQLKGHLQLLECELADKQNKMDQASTRVTSLEERAKKLQFEEKRCATLEDELRKITLCLSTKEQLLQEKLEESLHLQQELELSKADLKSLHGKVVCDRKRFDKQITTLKEEIKIQRAQLEKALHEQKHENSCLQKEMASTEQAAHDNHERAKRVLKELDQMRIEYFELKKQLRSQSEMEARQKEIKEAIRLLRSEVKSEINQSLKSLDQLYQEPQDDFEDIFQNNKKIELEDLKEKLSFASNDGRQQFSKEKFGFSALYLQDEQWRGEANREKLRQHEDHLKTQLRQRISRQAEVLSKQKQQAEGNLHCLKKQVDALDEIVSNSSTDFLSQSRNASGSTSSLTNDPEMNMSMSFCGSVRFPLKKTAVSSSSYRHNVEGSMTEHEGGGY